MFNRKDLLGLRDLSENEIMSILETAKQMKEKIDNQIVVTKEKSGGSNVTVVVG